MKLIPPPIHFETPEKYWDDANEGDLWPCSFIYSPALPGHLLVQQDRQDQRGLLVPGDRRAQPFRERHLFRQGRVAPAVPQSIQPE